MTNTLHRQGTAENLKGDYVLFATSAGGYNREGCTDKMKEFLRIAMRHQPINVRAVGGRPTTIAALEEALAKTPVLTTATVTFDNLAALQAAVIDLVKADLGISINISGLLEEVSECCRGAGITRHSVEHSLGFRGRTERLPAYPVLEINTMCGHGLVSFNLIKKVADYVKLDRLTPEKGAEYLARPCVCAAFNTTRAAQLLRQMRDLG